MNNQKIKKITILMLLFALSFFTTLFYKNIINNNQNRKESLILSNQSCLALNTFRESHTGVEEFLETNGKVKLIDIRSENKFQQFNLPGSINLPFWKVVLKPEKYKKLLTNNNTNLVCFFDKNKEWSDSHKVCFRYLRNYIYLLYGQVKPKIYRRGIDNPQIANEWEYYKIIDQLEPQSNYLVFFKEMDCENCLFIDLNKLNKQYALEKIKSKSNYDILCANDFSCLHAWAVKEKLKSLNINNIGNIDKVLNFKNNI
jgi:hypothetical protein